MTGADLPSLAAASPALEARSLLALLSSCCNPFPPTLDVLALNSKSTLQERPTEWDEPGAASPTLGLALMSNGLDYFILQTESYLHNGVTNFQVHMPRFCKFHTYILKRLKVKKNETNIIFQYF